MTNRKPEKLPPLEALLADQSMPLDLWRTAANAAVIREYMSGWPVWFAANRGLFRNADNAELRKETRLAYGKIAGKHTPWFRYAVDAARKCDAATEKPILALYFAAKIEALASLKTYQDNFQEKRKAGPACPVDEVIDIKIGNSAKSEPGAFLFAALANGYEHSFSFLFKMLGQFQGIYGRMPGVREYDGLTAQLAVHLFREAFLSRKENAIFETYFSETDNFFAFEHTGTGLKLAVNFPSDEQKAAIWQALEDHMPPEERGMQERRAQAQHYGCPAARGSNGEKGAVRFVAEDVFAAVRLALWPSHERAVEPFLPIEKIYRTHLAANQTV